MSRSFLAILPHNPGDVVMAFGALARIRAAYPPHELALDYVIGEECRELAENHPLLRHVHPLPRRALKESWAAGDTGAVLSRLEAWLADLNREPRDFSLNLYQERYGALLQALISADRKAGFELKEGRHFSVGSRPLEHLFAIPASRADNGWHAVDLYIRAARALIDPSGSRPWPLPAPGPLLPPLAPPPGWNGPAARAYFAFHPGSAWPGKKWPERHWASLAEACVRAGHSVVFTGAPEEQPGLRRILESLSGKIRASVQDWSGRTTLIGAAWIHANARMSVTGDTVAMHLAAASGTPTVALFGPSNPVETGPYGTGHFVFQTALDLPPDLDLVREHAGLAALPPQAVAAFLLEGAAPAGHALWETAWDEARDMQILRDPRGRLHPHQLRSAPLLDHLDGRPISRDATLPPTTDPVVTEALLRVLAALDRSLDRDGHPADLLDLESADRDLAGLTGDSLVWEAYRVALNGLPIRDIRQHLEMRRQRFRAAMREHEALHGASTAPKGRV